MKQFTLWSLLPEAWRPKADGPASADRARAAPPEQAPLLTKGRERPPAPPGSLPHVGSSALTAAAEPTGELPELLEARLPMKDRYQIVERAMLARYSVRVRKWRSSTSGVAWSVLYRDGTSSRLIESPRPRGPMSAAVFLHEIGHHAIGLGRYRPRCLEEFYAWAFSFHQMRLLKLPITDRVRTRAVDALAYALAKAQRRGIKRVPAQVAELVRAGRDGDLDRVEALLVGAGARLTEPVAGSVPA